jgi:hypothetical protein
LGAHNNCTGARKKKMKKKKKKRKEIEMGF